jgi:hypothetical protein
MKWVSVKEGVNFWINEVQSCSRETVIIVQVFSPLPNKLTSTLHAAQTVSIIGKLRLKSSVNLVLVHPLPIEKTDNYSLL